MTPSLPLILNAELVPIDQAVGGVVVPFQPARKTPQEAMEQFFAAQISNENTRSNYLRDVRRFASWCAGHGLTLHAITPVHVATYRDELVAAKKAPATVKRHLSALRMLFSYMVATGAMAYNPAREVKTEPIRRVEGKTHALKTEEMQRLFGGFDPERLIDLRDRALVGTMAYTFSRVSAACQLTAADYVKVGDECHLRFRAKGGVELEIPCHPMLMKYLDAWVTAAGIRGNAPLFPTFTGPRHDRQGDQAMSRQKALQMVKRRLDRAGLSDIFTSHSFRATGITTFLENGGSLETAQEIAGHADSRTTKGYDRRGSRLKLSEIARVTY